MSEAISTRQHDGSNADNGEITCAEYFEGEQVRHLLRLMQKNIHAGLPLTLKAAGVKKISTLGLQVLAAAKATANRSDLKFDIIAPSPEFERACADTGLNGLLGAGG